MFLIKLAVVMTLKRALIAFLQSFLEKVEQSASREEEIEP